jgi:signal recognition particle receptor subunit beta
VVAINHATRELTAKIVYYGPGLCGKTTNLQFIHDSLGADLRGQMVSLATETDRTLFFDFLPVQAGRIAGMRARMQLYTVPGQMAYDATRKLVLKGTDGIVFVADSQAEMLDANIASLRNLEANLGHEGLALASVPHVLQFNKRDLRSVLPVEELNRALNPHGAPHVEAVATSGVGVAATLKAISRLVLLDLGGRYGTTQPTAGGKALAVARERSG